MTARYAPKKVTSGYTSTAKALHWLMAVHLFGLLALGFYMHDLPLSPEKLKLYSWHKWAGVTAFLLVWLRLARPLLPLPETDRLYGELLKLEQLALQPLSDEALVERSAQAHTVWTLKAWKPLLK